MLDEVDFDILLVVFLPELARSPPEEALWLDLHASDDLAIAQGRIAFDLDASDDQTPTLVHFEDESILTWPSGRDKRGVHLRPHVALARELGADSLTRVIDG